MEVEPPKRVRQVVAEKGKFFFIGRHGLGNGAVSFRKLQDEFSESRAAKQLYVVGIPDGAFSFVVGRELEVEFSEHCEECGFEMLPSPHSPPSAARGDVAPLFARRRAVR